MSSFIRKLKTFTQLFIRSKNWHRYYLDYLGIFTENWRLTVDSLALELRPKSIDKWILAENMILDVYRLRKIKNKKFDLILDIGANIGAFAISAAREFPSCKIIAFEPDKENFAMLTTNIRLNKLTGKVKPLNSAVSVSRKKKIVLYKGTDFAANSTFKKSKGSTEVPNTEFSTLKKNITQNTLLKMDIEGGEIEIFTKKYVDFLLSFKYIILEYHHYLKSHKKEVLEKLLKKHNFSFKREGLIYFIEKASHS